MRNLRQAREKLERERIVGRLGGREGLGENQKNEEIGLSRWMRWNEHIGGENEDVRETGNDEIENIEALQHNQPSISTEMNEHDDQPS